MDILTDEIKITVENPDRIMNCDSCGRCFYFKKFKGKGELLVMAETIEENKLDIKCFGWIENMFYPS